MAFKSQSGFLVTTRYTSNIRLAPEDVKYKKKLKFEDHVMLCLYFSGKGLFKTLFFE